MRYVSWMFWSSTGGPSQRWSLVHRTADDKRTLCGRRIPDAFKYDHSDAGDMCERCRRKAEEISKKG